MVTASEAFGSTTEKLKIAYFQQQFSRFGRTTMRRVAVAAPVVALAQFGFMRLAFAESDGWRKVFEPRSWLSSWFSARPTARPRVNKADATDRITWTVPERVQGESVPKSETIGSNVGKKTAAKEPSIEEIFVMAYIKADGEQWRCQS